MPDGKARRPGSPGPVEHRAAELSRRVHHLGRVPAEPTTPARELGRPRRGPTQGPATRRPCPAPRSRPVRAVRQTDDRLLPQPQEWPGTELRLPTQKHRACGGGLPVRRHRQDRRGRRRVAAGDGGPAEPASRPGGPGLAANAVGRGGSASSATGATGPLRSRLAKQRFMRVDPNNRLVADALEAE